MKRKLALILGDGIGPEVISEAVKVLAKVERKYHHAFYLNPFYAGGIAIDQLGVPLPESTLKGCRKCHAVLLGAVGGPKWDGLPGHLRPEAGLLALRKGLGVFANLRPARIFPQLAAACPLKDSIVKEGLDLLIVREFTGGIYFGERGAGEDPHLGHYVYDVEKYSRVEIERILRVGFEAAQKRRHKLCLVDKANVLDSSRFWREIAREMAPQYADVALSYMYVDNAAMQLVRAPSQFDVIVTNNIFGDILSDEASQITGSIGMLPSASLGDRGPGFYEPIHGSAPDLAGTGRANPLAAILSGAMLLRYSLGLAKEADAVEAAVEHVLDEGWRTVDIAGDAPPERIVTCSRMGTLVADALGA
jgi:3-isopropylmalate dehydrogenase